MSHAPLSLKAAGWAATIGWEFLNLMMLAHQAVLGTSEAGQWHTLWLQTLYPGFQTLNATGVIVALVEGFIWPWVFAWIFVTVYNKCCK